MKLPDSLNDWIVLLGMIWGAVSGTIVAIWYLGRGRMAEELLQTPAMRLKDAQLEIQLRDQKIAHIEEMRRIENDHFRKVEEIRAQNDLDHKTLLAQIASTAEHKADIAVRPALEKMAAFEHRQERTEKNQEEFRKEVKADISQVFNKLDDIRKELMGAIQGAHA